MTLALKLKLSDYLLMQLVVNIKIKSLSSDTISGKH